MLFIILMCSMMITLGEVVRFFQKLKSKEICLHTFVQSKSKFVKRLFKKIRSNPQTMKSDLTI